LIRDALVDVGEVGLLDFDSVLQHLQHLLDHDVLLLASAR